MPNSNPRNSANNTRESSDNFIFFVLQILLPVLSVAGSKHKHKHGARGSAGRSRWRERILALSSSFAIGFLNGHREPDWQVRRGWVETVESSCCPTWAQPTGTRFPCIACHLNFGIPWAPHARLRSGPALFLPFHSPAGVFCPEVALEWPWGGPGVALQFPAGGISFVCASDPDFL
jgi:hypothetical protein